jgi:hypothetical protein
MANFTRDGYGQVEPNQLSAQKTGQIFASLRLDEEVNVLQNGEFMYYDYANGTVNAGKAAGTGTVATMGEPYLVFNEIKLYEPFWRTSYKDFAMIRVNNVNPTTGAVIPGENYVTSALATAGYGDGATTAPILPNPQHTEYPYRMTGFAPRLFKTNIGDIFTTNMVKTGVEYAVGDCLTPVKNTTTNTLQLEKATADPTTGAYAGMIWRVVQVYTMPDGQPGLKLQRVQ